MNRLFPLMICSLVSMLSVPALHAKRPKLVVNIIVDQLRTDYIEFLQTRFSDGGFRKLMNDGVYMRNIGFDLPGIDAVSATAMIYTGSYPATTGIPSAQVYDHTSQRTRNVLEDESKMGNYTNETYSPASLMLSTISDELAIDGAGLGEIHAISADPQQAIIMAGHAGNSAVWINTNTGKWATTTYYPSVPSPVNRANSEQSIASRIDTMQWQPLLPLETYEGVPAQKKFYPFRYLFSHRDKETYAKFALSPLGNREITNLAISYLNDLKLGRRADAIDMLNIAYTAAPFKYVADADYRLELQDIYLRLDRQIERLLNAIDKTVGLKNTLVFLSSTGYYDDAAIDDPKYRIPTGDFSTKRALSLLNAYLSATHGSADYVESFEGPFIYLDHKSIEQKGLSVAEIAKEAREFLCKMSGVSDAFSLQEILASDLPATKAIRLVTDPKQAGDIYVVFTPGWNEVHDIRYPVVKKPVRTHAAVTPAFILTPELAPRKINTKIDAVRLAPTLAATLRIRAPNGATAGAEVL